ncbi:MAG: GNAT family N-acetyltransferase [Candidatus Omnitrophica bacterium]|nr:GNAT family N-acetyltransferase [Candidatus Omnitrophota bacterium]
MNIRSVKKKDSAQVIKLIQDVVNAEFAPQEKEAYPMDDVLDLPASYQGRRDAFFVMSDGPQTIVGTCGVKNEGNGVGLIRRVFVRPSHRREGVAERLVRHSIQFAKNQGYRVLQVRTTSAMKAAIALLYKVGFQERATLEVGRLKMLKLTYNCKED